MKRLTYSQGLGVLSCKDGFLVTGYAGFETGKNNPAMDNVKNIGPLPRGVYRIVPEPFDHAKCGKYCIRLTPEPANVMHGRSGFLIHGDNGKGTASNGCIILPRHARESIVREKYTEIEVVA